MADELAVVIKTKLEIDEQQLHTDIGNLEKNGVKIPVEADSKSFNDSIGALQKNPPQINVQVNADQIVETLRKKLQTAKFNINVNTNAIANAVSNATEAATKKATRKRSSKSKVVGIPWDQVDGSNKYTAAVKKAVESHTSSLANEKATLSSVKMSYDTVKKMYTAVAQYNDGLGQTTSMLFKIKEGWDDVRVTQTNVTTSYKKQADIAAKTAKQVADYQIRLDEQKSKAFSQSNPIPEKHAGELKSMFSKAETMLNGIGNSISTEAEITIEKLFASIDNKMREVRSSILSPTKLASHYVDNQKLVEENTLKSFVAKMKNAGVFNDEMQRTVSGLEKSLSDVSDAKTLQSYLGEYRVAFSRFQTLKEEARAVKNEVANAQYSFAETAMSKQWQGQFLESIPGSQKNAQLDQYRDYYLRQESEAQAAYRQMFDDIQRIEEADEERRQTEYRALFDRAQREQAEAERITQAEREIAQINEKRDADSHKYWQQEFGASIKQMTASDPDSEKTRRLYQQEEADIQRNLKAVQQQSILSDKVNAEAKKMYAMLDDFEKRGFGNTDAFKRLDEVVNIGSIDNADQFAKWRADIKAAQADFDYFRKSVEGQAIDLAFNVDENQITAIRNMLDNDAIATGTTDGVVRLRTELQALLADYKTYTDILRSGEASDGKMFNDDDIKIYSEMIEGLDQRLASAAKSAKLFNDSLSSENSIAKANAQIEKLKNDLSTLEVNWSKALEIPELKADINSLHVALDNADAINLPNVQRAFTELRSKIKAAGADCKSFGSQLVDAFNQIKSYFSVAEIFQYVRQGVGEIVDEVKQLDSALTELRKVTDLSEQGYSQFMDRAAEQAKQIGTTYEDMVLSTSDFARLGYEIGDAEKLASVANVYLRVGDNIDSIDEASQSIISTMKAFDIDPSNAMSIVDLYNKVGEFVAHARGNTVSSRLLYRLTAA